MMLATAALAALMAIRAALWLQEALAKVPRLAHLENLAIRFTQVVAAVVFILLAAYLGLAALAAEATAAEHQAHLARQIPAAVLAAV